MKFDYSVHFLNTVLLRIHFCSHDKWVDCWKSPNNIIALNPVPKRKDNKTPYMCISPGVTVTSWLITNQPIFIETTDTLTNGQYQLILDICDIFVRAVVAFRV